MKHRKGLPPGGRRSLARRACAMGNDAGAPGDEFVIATDPGCDDPRHREEVQGAMMALMVRGGVPWSGPTTMDCGCVLRLVPWSEAF